LYLERQVQLMSEKLEKAATDSSSQMKGQLQLLNEFKLIPAKVIDNSVAKTDNFITLDKGSADGVRKDMGVACGTGVVGIVYLVSSHYSVVIPVLNSKSNISCAIQGRGYFGYLHWAGGRSDVAYVDDIPRHARFELGDVVETSGFSSVFPPGIYVGRVADIHDSADGLAYQLEVELSTDLANVRDVCIVMQEHEEELDSMTVKSHR
jgi:rod shape-determining protein MreC